MRSETDIVWAHDLLVGVICRDVPVDLSPEMDIRLRVACDALCWVLEHRGPEHGRAADTFEANLKKIESDLVKLGYRLEGGLAA